MNATVTKAAARRFVVEGVIAVLGERRVNEAYVRVHATKAAADRDAASLDRQNAEAIAHLDEITAARRARVEGRLAARAVRRDRGQLAFDL